MAKTKILNEVLETVGKKVDDIAENASNPILSKKQKRRAKKEKRIARHNAANAKNKIIETTSDATSEMSESTAKKINTILEDTGSSTSSIDSTIMDIRSGMNNNTIPESPMPIGENIKTSSAPIPPEYGPTMKNSQKRAENLKRAKGYKEAIQQGRKENEAKLKMKNTINKWTKTVVGAGVSGAIVFNMFNSGGKMSNSELYGQQQRY